MRSREDRGALWLWMAESRLFKQVIVPLIPLGLLAMFLPRT
ncbi:MAG: hypothetical protein ABIP64_02300 [Burkholderiales bacterium]